MTKFYFDLFDAGREVSHDEEGAELESVENALDEAVMALAELAKDAVKDAGSPRKLTLRVRDERGTPILETEMRFAVRSLPV